MVEVLVIALALGALFYRMQTRKQSRKALKATRGRAKSLSAGNFEALAAELDLPIRRKPLAGFSVELLAEKLEAARGKRLGGKFQVLSLRRGAAGDLLVLADGKIRELVPGNRPNQYVDRFYSCCLYLHPDGEQLEFRSAFPEDKDHQFLLEDLCDHIYPMGLQHNR